MSESNGSSLEGKIITSIVKRKVVNHPDYKKRNKTSRRRGYDFEDSLVKKFKALEHWNARRLGGSSTGLPDVVATRNPTETEFSTVMAIECKEGRDTYTLEVPADQIQRCIDTCNFLGAYHKQYVVFAFKFMKSEKLKRDKTVIRFWCLPLNDYFLNLRPIDKVRYDIRLDRIAVCYKDAWTEHLGRLVINGWRESFDVLVSESERSAQYIS